LKGSLLLTRSKVFTDLSLTGMKLGSLLNFADALMEGGITRMFYGE
jgi:hypothetical protein